MVTCTAQSSSIYEKYAGFNLVSFQVFFSYKALGASLTDPLIRDMSNCQSPGREHFL